jgi:hypothetical protein
MIRNLQENFENKLDSKQNSINEIVKQERKRKKQKRGEKNLTRPYLFGRAHQQPNKSQPNTAQTSPP